MYKGSIPALITPFKGGEIDWASYENLIERQIDQGSHGLVPCGTTGESPSLSYEEHNALVAKCVEITRKRVPVIAGTGANSTAEAIELTLHAYEVGVDAALIVVPYYNKPTQEGMYQHYKAIHEAVNIPIIIYNIPGRSVVNMSPETMARLAELPNIIGVKDATNDLDRVLVAKEMCGDDFCILSGEDPTFPGFLAQGGHGIISVLANVAPKLNADLYKAWDAGDLEGFGKLRDMRAPLARDLFCETSPAPIKYACSVMGLCENELRLPMVPASKDACKKVDVAMAHAGIKNNVSKIAAAQ